MPYLYEKENVKARTSVLTKKSFNPHFHVELKLQF